MAHDKALVRVGNNRAARRSSIRPSGKQGSKKINLEKIKAESKLSDDMVRQFFAMAHDVEQFGPWVGDGNGLGYNRDHRGQGEKPLLFGMFLPENVQPPGLQVTRTFVANAPKIVREVLMEVAKYRGINIMPL